MKITPTPLLQRLSCLALILLLHLSFGISTGFSQQTSVSQSNLSFRFSLSNDCRTSAGVFLHDSTLITTLWSGRYLKSGDHQESWDGKDDDGKSVPIGLYKIRILSNNVKYEWEGVIGNTSINTSGYSRHNWTDRIWDMIIIDSFAYFAVGYTEGTPSQHKFNIRRPNVMEDIWKGEKYAESKLTSRNVCSDGKTVFWSVNDPNSANISGVVATKVFDDQEVIFKDGKSYKSKYGRTYPSLIDFVEDKSDRQISGIGVQRVGKYLFVARKATNELHVIDKNSGALVQIINLTEPERLCVDDEDNIWIIIAGNQIKCFKVNIDGSLTPKNKQITGLQHPLSVSIDPENHFLVVADGGSSQQFKAFDLATLEKSWIYGRSGGYFNSPEITDDKFCFTAAKRLNEATDNEEISFIAFQPDGNVWLGDGGNQRALKLDKNRQEKLDEIICLGYHYSTFADRNDSSRVFANYLEFAIDYSKPLKPNNGSWKLVRNWVGNVQSKNDNQFSRLKYVTTLSNHRTYAFAQNESNNFELIELSETGLRSTGIKTKNLNVSLESNGDLNGIKNTAIGEIPQWTKQTLTGFDINHNPQYAHEEIIAHAPAITSVDPISNSGGMYNHQTTSSNIIACFSEDKPGTYQRGNGYHLGGIKVGDNKWLWRTSFATHLQYQGEFPSNGDYDIGNSVQYGGSHVTTLERSIFYGYNGEFWKNSQTNKWNHFYDNGLFIGQFGITGIDAQRISAKAAPGMAGNAINFSFIKVGDAYYLYHCDETHHSATHRWKITGLHSITEQVLDVSKTDNVIDAPSNFINLMDGLPFNDSLHNEMHGWTRYPSFENLQNDYTNKWSVRTNVKTYKKTERDVYIEMRPAKSNMTQWVKRDLGINTGLKSWKVSGFISYPEVSETGENTIEILDKFDRVIARISRPLISNPIMAIMANKTMIIKAADTALAGSMTKLQPISIKAENGNITVGYGDYPAVETSVFDQMADWRSPKTMKITMHSPDLRGHVIDLANFKMFLNEESNYTTLPQRFISIEVTENINGINVDWTSMEEGANIERYVIESSFDGKDFQIAGSILSNKTPRQTKNYTWLDIRARNFPKFYRIKMVEKTGEFLYSKIVKADFNRRDKQISIYPNPIVGNEANIYLSNLDKGKYIIKVFNNTGELFNTKALEYNGGATSTTLSMNLQMPHGTYNVQVNGKYFRYTGQLVK